MKTAAVIVTYNRKELLARNLKSLSKQSRKPDVVIIIDNNSTDGTPDFIEAQDFYDAQWINMITLDENTGGAGGFSYGLKYAFDNDADYIWLMDDDGYSFNDETFNNILTFGEHIHNNINSKIFINSLVTYDGVGMSFGELSGTEKSLDIFGKTFKFIEKSANPFNGTLLSRETVESVGLPNKDFFIINDEMDYYSRCIANDVYIATLCNSVYVHPRQKVVHHRFLLWHLTVYNFSSFKLYYDIRNKVYYLESSNQIKKLYKDLANRFLSILLYEDNKVEKIKTFKKAIYDGHHKLLGKRY